MRYYIYILFLGLSSLSSAQLPGYYFLDGWTADATYQFEDSFFSIGIKSSEDFRSSYIVKTKSDLSFNNSRGVQYKFDSSATTSAHGANLLFNNSIYFSGVFKDSLSSDSIIGFIAKCNLNGNVIKQMRLTLGNLNFIKDIVPTDDGNIAIVGHYKAPSSRIHGYFQLLDTNLSTIVVKRYLCQKNIDNNECREMDQQIAETRDGNFIYSASYTGGVRPDIAHSIVRKIDRRGEVIWSYTDKNDTHSFHDPVIIELANGNVLLMAKRQWYLPFKNPDENGPIPTLDLNGSTFISILDKDGELIEIRDVRELVEKFYLPGKLNYNYLSSEDIIATSDSGFVICGHSRVNNGIGYQGGFLLKLDSNGNQIWFRRYQPDTCDLEGEEDTYIYGVSELRDGGFALSGRYICDGKNELVADAIVIITDEKGCIEPGCEKLVSVQDIAKSAIKVMPNPSTGKFKIQDEKANIQSIEIYDIFGKQVAFDSHKVSDAVVIELNVSAGLYFLRILNQNREVQILRAVVR